MKLARFIQTEMHQLLEDFAEAAVKIAPELRGQHKAALEDHARQMLEFVIEDLLTRQTVPESARKALGEARSPISIAAEQHGASRLGQGLSMLQAIQELRALRARVTKSWGDSLQGPTTEDIEELVRFNESIDQLIVNSLARYSGIKEQDAHLFEAVLRVSPDPTTIFDPGGKLLFLNMPMANLLGMTPEQAIGRTPVELALSFAPELDDAIAATVATGAFQRRELLWTSPSAQDKHFDCQLVPVFNDDSEVEAVATTSRDITERKQAERRVWRSANFDALTGIPNRRLFLDRLEQTLLEARRQDRSFALLFIDLDHFKQANDQLGHSAGDRLLEQVAQRINGKVRAMDTLARLGGDEFTLILKDTSREGAQMVAEALLASLEQPFSIESHQVYISASMGLALFPENGKDGVQLMHYADQAMYAAKQRGGRQIQQIVMNQNSNHEGNRLQALRAFELLDTPADGSLDHITALAANYFNTPISLISLIDQDRIWFMSRHGIDASEVEVEPGLCASAFLQENVYVVEDAATDPRSLANSLVSGEMGVRFYAAAPLRTREGYGLGTINIIDFEPRSFSEKDRTALMNFGQIVMNQMELRLSSRLSFRSLAQIYDETKGSDHMVTVCAWSKKILIDNHWLTLEEFFTEKLGLKISHGLNPNSVHLFEDGN